MTKAIPFAAKTVDLIEKAMSKDSEQYRIMKLLLYDQKFNRSQGIIEPSNYVILERINQDDAFDDLINNCISHVKSFGIFKHPTDKKNILGDLDNSILYTLLTLFFIVSFSIGVFATNFGLMKYFNPDLNDTSIQEKVQTQKPSNKLLPGQQIKPKKTKE